MLGSYLWGGLSDIMGNRKLLPAFSSIFLPVTLLLFSIAVSPVQVIILRGLVGLIFPAYVSPISALVSEEVKRRERGKKLGWFNSMRSLGSTIGLFLAGYLVAYLSLNSVFRLFAFLAVFSIVPLLLIPGDITKFTMPEFRRILTDIKKKMLPTKEGGKQILRKKGLIYIYLSLTLRVICIVGFASFLPIYIVKVLGYSEEFLGIFSGFGNGLMIIGMFVAGWTADKLGRRIIVTVGFLLSGLTPIFYSISDNLITLSLGRIFHSLGYCFVMGGISAFVGDVASEGSQGSFMGLITVFFSIGGIIGPLIMGTFVGYLGYFRMGIVMSLFAFSAMVMIVSKVKETLPLV
jgi:MFS family permease